jgi:large subunit ribosomal protein L13
MAKVIERENHIIDAADRSPGRVATEVAIILRGKNKPAFQPHMDCGDIVVVQNAGQMKYTGKKLEQKKYRHHSGYPGGLKEKKMSDVEKNDPGEVLRRTIKNMLPAVRFRDNMMRRLTINK